jgi:hypothetical protein
MTTNTKEAKNIKKQAKTKKDLQPKVNHIMDMKVRLTDRTAEKNICQALTEAEVFAIAIGNDGLANGLSQALTVLKRYLNDDEDFKDMALEVVKHPVQNVIIEMARELSGLKPPRITTNPLVKAYGPITLNRQGIMKLNTCHVLQALPLVMENAQFDLRKTHSLIKRHCLETFKMHWDPRSRTTVTVLNAEQLGLKQRERTYFYETNVRWVMDVARDFNEDNRLVHRLVAAKGYDMQPSSEVNPPRVALKLAEPVACAEL